MRRREKKIILYNENNDVGANSNFLLSDEEHVAPNVTFCWVNKHFYLGSRIQYEYLVSLEENNATVNLL